VLARKRGKVGCRSGVGWRIWLTAVAASSRRRCVKMATMQSLRCCSSACAIGRVWGGVWCPATPIAYAWLTCHSDEVASPCYRSPPLTSAARLVPPALRSSSHSSSHSSPHSSCTAPTTAHSTAHPTVNSTALPTAHPTAHPTDYAADHATGHATIHASAHATAHYLCTISQLVSALSALLLYARVSCTVSYRTAQVDIYIVSIQTRK